MIEDGESVNGNITSFLLECLVWNVPDWIFNGHKTWTDRLENSILFLIGPTRKTRIAKIGAKFLVYCLFSIVVANGREQMLMPIYYIFGVIWGTHDAKHKH